MKQHTDLRSNKLLNLCDGFMFGQENPTAPDGIDGLRTNIKGCPEGRSSFGSVFPIGASSIPVGTRLSPGKSSVLYLCGADGSRNCTVAAFWREGLPLAGQHKRQKKAGRRCGQALSVSRVICGTRYIKAPVSRCFPSYQNHHGSFPRRLSIASPSTFFVQLSLRWKWSAAPISGCSIPSVKP